MKLSRTTTASFLSSSYTISRGFVPLFLLFLGFVRGDSVLFRSTEYSTGALGYGPYQSYFSANYTPAEWNFVVPVNDSANAPSLSAGSIFSAPRGASVLREGAAIYDQSGSLIWDGSIYGQTLSFSVVTYLGEPHIILWTGTVTSAGVGTGYDILLNSKYELVANFTTVNIQGETGQALADLHEAQITSNNTALMTSYPVNSLDLSPIDGPEQGYILDSAMQELNISSNEPLFTWIASEHVNITECYNTPGTGGGSVDEAFDYFHINAIEKDDEGNYLISSRHCWTVYYLDGTNGDILWRMGGKNSSFTMGNGTSFSWQHHARWIEKNDTYGTMTLFDNAGQYGQQQEQMSRGLYLGLNFTNMTVELLTEFLPWNQSISQSQGSVQLQPNGNFLVGFGQLPWTGEYTPDGDLLWTAQFGVGDVESYRALRYNWTGTPTDSPSIDLVSASTSNLLSVHASWNGATEIVKWELYGASDSSGSNSISLYNQTKNGFETTITVSNAYSHYAVRAIGKSNQVLGSSDFVSSPAIRLGGRFALALLSASIVLGLLS
ncbi:ASST-domain-containing protein [Lentinula boryana]|uniref:ASST-domain-containing protein n=1 Tax=Lentinula boryana TaxID=40481 RepID=A0ABQ8PYP2_9AGAR|nr:ASST-domain-containing protein [Lentinula boryana]